MAAQSWFLRESAVVIVNSFSIKGILREETCFLGMKFDAPIISAL